VYIRARYFFLHSTHECPRDIIIALLNSKITFSQTTTYIYAARDDSWLLLHAILVFGNCRVCKLCTTRILVSVYNF